MEEGCSLQQPFFRIREKSGVSYEAAEPRHNRGNIIIEEIIITEEI